MSGQLSGCVEVRTRDRPSFVQLVKTDITATAAARAANVSRIKCVTVRLDTAQRDAARKALFLRSVRVRHVTIYLTITILRIPGLTFWSRKMP